MRAEMLLDEMDNYIPNFNIIPKLEIPQLNCENIQAFMLNFPQNCKNTINTTLFIYKQILL